MQLFYQKLELEALNLYNKITEEFTTDELIPCAGQGIIAIQCRQDDVEIIKLLEDINDDQAES